MMPNEYANFMGWATSSPPPYKIDDINFYALGFPVDGDACQKYLDATYNRLGGQQQFRLLIDYTFVLIMRSPKLYALTPPFDGQGSQPEIDFGFWFAVGCFEEGNPLPTVKWLPGLLLVDNCYAVQLGREVFGYPKYQARLVAPDTGPSGGPFTATAMLTRKFTTNASAREQGCFSLNAPSFNRTAPVGGATDVLRELCSRASPDRLETFINTADQAGLVGSVGGLPFPVWYFKQFRAGDGSATAIYQEILEGTLELNAINDCAMLWGDWTLELGAFDSLPFVKAFGLGTPNHEGKLTLTTNVAFWSSCDVTAGTASVFT